MISICTFLFIGVCWRSCIGGAPPDLTGLPEAPVDSEDDEEEDEDIDRTSDPLLGRDVVRECLEKEPADKTDDDIGEK